jgi:hypothetical protein
MIQLASRESTATRFRRLADRWRRETGHLSSLDDMCMHPAYQHIIGMGTDALPLIFEELAQRPDHWFWALNAITEEDPIPPPARGNVPAMTDAWLKWGEEHGYSRRAAAGNGF